MNPEFDPNEAIERAIKSHGEFLRDTDKGMSSTETALNVDLGTIRADHDDTMDSMGEVANGGEVDIAAAQSSHGRAFAEMGRVIHRERLTHQEKPVNVTVDPAELERLSFPGEQHQSHVRSSMESVLREDREYKAAEAELFWMIAEQMRQMRLELDQVRGFLERIPL